MNALKGKGKGYKGKGKGSTGGEGKGYKGGGWQGGYRSPGEVVGKGLNYYGQEDYAEVWGEELYNQDYAYNGEDWGHDAYNNCYIGNVTMMLERGNECTEIRKFGKREVLT